MQKQHLKHEIVHSRSKLYPIGYEIRFNREKHQPDRA